MREIEDLRSTLLSLSSGFGVRFEEFDEHFGEVTRRYNKASASLDRHRKEINSSESRIRALEKLVAELQTKVCHCVSASSPVGSKGFPIPVEDSEDGLEYLDAPVAEDGPGPQDVESRCFAVREEVAPPATVCQKFACCASHFLRSHRRLQLLFNFTTLISFHLHATP